MNTDLPSLIEQGMPLVDAWRDPLKSLNAV